MKKLYLFIFSVLFLFFGCTDTEASETIENKAGTSEFHIIAFEPEGILPSAVKYPVVYVQFSEPVISLQALGEPSNHSDYMSIEPPLDGVYRWLGTSLLSFQASEATVAQREYIVNVNTDTVSINGTPLSGTTAFSFTTEELQLLSVIPGYNAINEGRWVDFNNISLEDASNIALTFSWNINPDVVSKYINVTANDTSFDFTVKQEPEKENQLFLTLTEPLPENTLITVSLNAGAKSEEGYIGTRQIQSKEFHTITPFEVNNINTSRSSYGKYINPVYVTFSHQLSGENIDDVISGITTLPPMPVTGDNVEISGSQLIIYGLPVEFDQTYSLEIPATVQDIYGRTLMSQEAIITDVTVPPAASYAYFKNYGFKMLEAEFAPKLIFEHQNILEGSKYSVSSIKNSDVSPLSVDMDVSAIPQNTRVSELIDLAPFLQKNNDGMLTGSVLFNAAIQYRALSWRTEKYEEYTNKNTLALQVTDLGLTVRYGYNKALVFVTSLSTGEPVENALVELLPVSHEMYTDYEFLRDSTQNSIAQATTNANGLAVISFDPGEYKNNFTGLDMYVRAVNGNDSAVFYPTGNGTYWTNPLYAENVSMQTFIFTDRELYKPGETMTFRGIDRNLQLGEYTPYVGSYEIQIMVAGSDEVLYEITDTSSASGGFWGRWNIPETAEPNSYYIAYKRNLPNGTESRINEYFTVQYFERLRFEASISVPDMVYVSGDRIDASLKAQYLGGGSLAKSNYESSWYISPTYFNPDISELEGYKFGPSIESWGQRYVSASSGTLNADGSASFGVSTGSEPQKGLPYFYEVSASVTDAGNQEISASTRKIVHPADFYIGLSSAQNINGFAKKEQSLDFKYVLIKADGTLPTIKDFATQQSEQTVTVELLREDWKAVQQVGVSGQLNTRYVKETVVEESLVLDLHTASDITSGAGSFTVTPPKGGVYILRLTSVDSEGREVITERFFYVTGSDWYFFQGNESDEISLQPDKDEYAVGETAQILLNSPIPQGQYLMTIEREGIFSEKIIELTEPSTVLEIPIEDTYVPIVYVALSSYTVRTGEPVHDFSTPDLDKPKGLFGTTALYVNTDSRSFDIEVIADKTSYRPGDTVELTVKATKNNEPVDNAEITLMAVDRGVIDLINYHVPNPVEYFYADYKFSNHVRGGDSRSLLIDPVTYEVKNLFGGDASATENSEKTETRDNFDPTAVFEPYLVTDENGIITHSFTLPDTLTSYRITAVGVKENNFSLNESEIDVNNPISVRDVLPRRLREGDISETGVVISNLDSIAHDVTVDLAIFEGAERSGIAPRNDGLLRENGRARVEGNATYTIRVEPNSTESIMFFMEAQDFGFVTVEFTVTSDILNERILQPLEIDRPYMYETVTTVGKVLADNQERENIIIGEYADITLSLASDLLGTLNDSVQYVFRYPYGCLEQRLSAMLPLTVFADYIDAFGLSSEVSDPKQVVETELQTFAAFQNTDGGFPYWSSNKFSSLSVSMRFAEFLVKAQENGIEIPKGIDISALVTYIRAETLKAYENAPSSNTSYVATQRAGAVFMRAYGLYVTQKLLQNQNINLADIPFDDEGNDIASLSLCGLLYLNQDNIEKAVETEKRVSTYLKPTTRGIDITPVFDSSYSAWSFFNTTSEQYALLLQFYTALNAHNLQESYTDISDRLIYELSQQQKASRGYWQSTATTARVLIAIDEYIKANDLTNTDIIAEASLKGENILFGAFEGLGNQPITRTANFAELAEETGIQANEENTVTFNAEGEGSIFYTLSMRYPIDVCEQTYRDEGLNVFVDIKDAQTGESVSGDNLVAGNVYRAIVTLSSTQHRNFVALRVPIPSGAEVINASFVTTGNTAKYAESETEAAGYTYGLSNQAIYDNEVQYFWDYLRAGYRQVDFLFRAVRKGSFTVPAAQAECMYEPEVFGRYMGKQVTIE